MNFSCQADEYEYQWDGKKRTGKSFSGVFVSPDNPSEYCMGQMRWTFKSDNKFRSLQQKLSNGLAFTMTKVSLISDAKKQYIHSPIQTVVNVAETHFSPLLHSKEKSRCPEPPATIADCSHLTNEQLFDVTALVRTVGMHRPVKDTRVVFDIDIIDGSKDGERVRTMPLSVFTDRPSMMSHPPMWSFLQEASKNGAAQPVSFFRIKGSQDKEGKFSFSTTKTAASLRLQPQARDVDLQKKLLRC